MASATAHNAGSYSTLPMVNEMLDSFLVGLLVTAVKSHLSRMCSKPVYLPTTPISIIFVINCITLYLCFSLRSSVVNDLLWNLKSITSEYMSSCFLYSKRNRVSCGCCGIKKNALEAAFQAHSNIPYHVGSFCKTEERLQISAFSFLLTFPPLILAEHFTSLCGFGLAVQTSDGGLHHK